MTELASATRRLDQKNPVQGPALPPARLTESAPAASSRASRARRKCC